MLRGNLEDVEQWHVTCSDLAAAARGRIVRIDGQSPIAATGRSCSPRERTGEMVASIQTTRAGGVAQ
jgi:hypothetical protein